MANNQRGPAGPEKMSLAFLMGQARPANAPESERIVRKRPHDAESSEKTHPAKVPKPSTPKQNTLRSSLPVISPPEHPNLRVWTFNQDDHEDGPEQLLPSQQQVSAECSTLGGSLVRPRKMPLHFVRGSRSERSVRGEAAIGVHKFPPLLPGQWDEFANILRNLVQGNRDWRSRLLLDDEKIVEVRGMVGLVMAPSVPDCVYEYVHHEAKSGHTVSILEAVSVRRHEIRDSIEELTGTSSTFHPETDGLDLSTDSGQLLNLGLEAYELVCKPDSNIKLDLIRRIRKWISAPDDDPDHPITMCWDDFFDLSENALTWEGAKAEEAAKPHLHPSLKYFVTFKLFVNFDLDPSRPAEYLPRLSQLVVSRRMLRKVFPDHYVNHEPLARVNNRTFMVPSVRLAKETAYHLVQAAGPLSTDNEFQNFLQWAAQGGEWVTEGRRSHVSESCNDRSLVLILDRGPSLLWFLKKGLLKFDVTLKAYLAHNNLLPDNEKFLRMDWQQAYDIAIKDATLEGVTYLKDPLEESLFQRLRKAVSPQDSDKDPASFRQKNLAKAIRLLVSPPLPYFSMSAGTENPSVSSYILESLVDITLDTTDTSDSLFSGDFKLWLDAYEAIMKERGKSETLLKLRDGVSKQNPIHLSTLYHKETAMNFMGRLAMCGSLSKAYTEPRLKNFRYSTSLGVGASTPEGKSGPVLSLTEKFEKPERLFLSKMLLCQDFPGYFSFRVRKARSLVFDGKTLATENEKLKLTKELNEKLPGLGNDEIRKRLLSWATGYQSFHPHPPSDEKRPRDTTAHYDSGPSLWWFIEHDWMSIDVCEIQLIIFFGAKPEEAHEICQSWRERLLIQRMAQLTT